MHNTAIQWLDVVRHQHANNTALLFHLICLRSVCPRTLFILPYSIEIRQHIKEGFSAE